MTTDQRSRLTVQKRRKWKKGVYNENGKERRTGPWTSEEDEQLLAAMSKVKPDTNNWSRIAAYVPTRDGKQCRSRWCNYLEPGIKRTPWTKDEDELIVKHQNLLENNWKDIATKVKGRTGGQIKSRWNSCLSKRSRNGILLAFPRYYTSTQARGRKRKIETKGPDTEDTESDDFVDSPPENPSKKRKTEQKESESSESEIQPIQPADNIIVLDNLNFTCPSQYPSTDFLTHTNNVHLPHNTNLFHYFPDLNTDFAGFNLETSSEEDYSDLNLLNMYNTQTAQQQFAEFVNMSDGNLSQNGFIRQFQSEPVNTTSTYQEEEFGLHINFDFASFLNLDDELKDFDPVCS